MHLKMLVLKWSLVGQGKVCWHSHVPNFKELDFKVCPFYFGLNHPFPTLIKKMEVLSLAKTSKNISLDRS